MKLLRFLFISLPHCQSEDSSDLEVSQGLGQGLALTRSRLWLDCVQPSDEALYTCVAENSFERRSASTSLKVASLGDSLLPANSLAFCATKKAYGKLLLPPS